MRQQKSAPIVGLPTSPDQRTGFLLRLAHQFTWREFNDALRSVGIETRHLGVLTAVAEHGMLSQARCVELLGLDKSVVVLIVDDLERLGLAQRKPDSHDRRAHAIQVTNKGQKSLKAAQAIAERLGRSVFAGLTQKDRTQLDELLSRIIMNCQGVRPEDRP
jgi:DNA-binding MarR family transcriptional regulator